MFRYINFSREFLRVTRDLFYFRSCSELPRGCNNNICCDIIAVYITEINLFRPYFYSEFLLNISATCIPLMLDISKEILISACFYVEGLFLDENKDVFSSFLSINLSCHINCAQTVYDNDMARS